MELRKVCPWGDRSPSLAGALLEARHKDWICQSIIKGEKSIAYFIEKYKLKRSTVSDWVQRARKQLPLNAKSGRPARVSPSVVSKWLSVINLSDVCFPVAEGKKILDDLNLTDEVQRTGKDSCLLEPISMKTFDRIRKKFEVKIGNAETYTDARLAAVRDIRNAVSFAAAQVYMVPLVPSSLMINSDATQFEVGEHAGLVKVLYQGCRRDHGGPLKAQPTSKEETVFFIKYYCTMTAAGELAPAVFIVADGNMAVGTKDVYKVAGLGLDCSTTNMQRLIKRLGEHILTRSSAPSV